MIEFGNYLVEGVGKRFKDSKKRHMWNFYFKGTFYIITLKDSITSKMVRIFLNKQLLYDNKVSEEIKKKGLTFSNEAFSFTVIKFNDNQFDLLINGNKFISGLSLELTNDIKESVYEKEEELSPSKIANPIIRRNSLWNNKTEKVKSWFKRFNKKQEDKLLDDIVLCTGDDDSSDESFDDFETKNKTDRKWKNTKPLDFEQRHQSDYKLSDRSNELKLKLKGKASYKLNNFDKELFQRKQSIKQLNALKQKNIKLKTIGLSKNFLNFNLDENIEQNKQRSAHNTNKGDPFSFFNEASYNSISPKKQNGISISNNKRYNSNIGQKDSKKKELSLYDLEIESSVKIPNKNEKAEEKKNPFDQFVNDYNNSRINSSNNTSPINQGNSQKGSQNSNENVFNQFNSDKKDDNPSEAFANFGF